MSQVGVRPFENSMDHLLAELALLDLMLFRHVRQVRNRNTAQAGSDFEGLFVSEQGIDVILSQSPIVRDEDETSSDPSITAIQQQMETLAIRTSVSSQKGVFMRLERLCQIFGLDSFEKGLMALCIAPELDLRYETLYAYIQDDVSKKLPTISLALSLFCSTLSDWLARRRFLAASSPLLRYELVRLGGDEYSGNDSFLSRSLRADRAVAHYLLGSDAIDARLEPLAKLAEPSASWEQVVHTSGFKKRLIDLSANLEDMFTQTVLQFVGPVGTGKKATSQAMCHDIDRRLLFVDSARLLTSDSPHDEIVNLIFKEAMLKDAVLYLDKFHLLLGEESRQKSLLAALMKGLVDRRDLTILAGETSWRPESGIEGHAFLTLEFASPEYLERQQLWEVFLDIDRDRFSDEEIGLLAGKFRLTGGQIQQVVRTGRDFSRLRPQSEWGLTLEDLHVSARWNSSQRLSLLARKIQPSYRWDDIVLPPDQKAQLREICGYFANMALVYGQWGFQSKTSLGKGLNILFAGASGTGKTMAADVMAGELALDLFKIDLASIVSKYIGETEKNLDRIFQEAQGSNAILFFDESDALFGKRSEVKDAHDRYANIEVSYLLQKMEEYQGIVILATNFRNNMDDAFVRRMHFVLDFPVPDEEDRLEIWQRVFPGEAPLNDSVDLSFLARQFKIAGGNIKNIAVSSAFLAAQDDGRVAMKHIILATRREYQKMGRLLVESDFGQYFGLVSSAHK